MDKNLLMILRQSEGYKIYNLFIKQINECRITLSNLLSPTCAV